MLTVTSSDVTATITSVKNSGSVVNASNYTISSRVLTIRKEYLTTLANGAKAITIVMSVGSELTSTITVGD